MDFNQLLDLLLTPSAILTVLIVVSYYARLMLEKFVSKGDLEMIDRITLIAVKAAEQLVKMGQLDKDARMPFVLETVQTELEKIGIIFDPNFIMSIVESQVLDLPKTKN